MTTPVSKAVWPIEMRPDRQRERLRTFIGSRAGNIGGHAEAGQVMVQRWHQTQLGGHSNFRHSARLELLHRDQASRGLAPEHSLHERGFIRESKVARAILPVRCVEPIARRRVEVDRIEVNAVRAPPVRIDLACDERQARRQPRRPSAAQRPASPTPAMTSTAGRIRPAASA